MFRRKFFDFANPTSDATVNSVYVGKALVHLGHRFIAHIDSEIFFACRSFSKVILRRIREHLLALGSRPLQLVNLALDRKMLVVN